MTSQGRRALDHYYSSQNSYRRRVLAVSKPVYPIQPHYLIEHSMRDKPAVAIGLVVSWLFWFLLFLYIGI